MAAWEWQCPNRKTCSKNCPQQPNCKQSAISQTLPSWWKLSSDQWPLMSAFLQLKYTRPKIFSTFGTLLGQNSKNISRTFRQVKNRNFAPLTSKLPTWPNWSQQRMRSLSNREPRFKIPPTVWLNLLSKEHWLVYSSYRNYRNYLLITFSKKQSLEDELEQVKEKSKAQESELNILRGLAREQSYMCNKVLINHWIKSPNIYEFERHSIVDMTYEMNASISQFARKFLF